MRGVKAWEFNRFRKLVALMNVPQNPALWVFVFPVAEFAARLSIWEFYRDWQSLSCCAALIISQQFLGAATFINGLPHGVIAADLRKWKANSFLSRRWGTRVLIPNPFAGCADTATI